MDTASSRRFRLAVSLPLVAGMLLAGTSCTTTYDQSGRPVQSVDPGAAVAGAAAVGILGYAIGNNNRSHRNSGYRNDYGYRRPHYGPHYGPRY